MNDHSRRYSAFISYRHHSVDRFHAQRLMRALELLRVPRELRRQGYPAKLDPVFRDDDEAGAHGALSAQLQEALTSSHSLIVICTPRTQQSEWVKREVEFFRSLGRGDRIIPVIVDGEPSEALPDYFVDGKTGWDSVQPLAVDLRPQADEKRSQTFRRGVLRVAAALLECRYDDLAQRAEAEERRRFLQRVAAASAAVLLLLVGGTVWWDAMNRTGFAGGSLS